MAKIAATKYRKLAVQYIFQPVALESLGPMDSDTRDVLVDLGGRIARVSSAEIAQKTLALVSNLLKLQLHSCQTALITSIFDIRYFNEVNNNNNK